MSLFFPNMKMKRYTRTPHGKGVYGEKVKQYTYTGDINVDFQHENNQEIARRYGVERENLYKIYINLDTTLMDDDLLVDHNGLEYQVVGEIQDYNHFHNYRRVHLQRSRGSMI